MQALQSIPLLSDGLDPLLVWGLFPRALGIVFLISFVSLLPQVGPIAGETGMVPIGRRLGRMREHFGWRAVLYVPTLLWIDSRDATLKLLTVLGIGASIWAIVGGPGAWLALPLCWLLYVSLDAAIGLVFPWDALLLEASFFAIFLPPTLALPELAAVAAPAPAIAWVYRLLIFRVLFGFGKLKFFGSKPEDLDYLKGFLLNQPLPSPLGWLAQGLPVALLKLAMIFMFVVELIVPFFVFFPGTLSIVAAFAFVALMVGIQLSGNFGYFNILVIALCVVLLDSNTPRQLDFATLFAPDAPFVTNAVVLLHTFGALIAFPFNSFLANSWMYWPVLLRAKPRLLLAPIALIRALHPLRWLHTYGVFPPKTPAGVKGVVVIEGTWDGEHWKELHPPISPSHPESAPKFVAPFHHRNDQALVYETFGLNDKSLFTGVTAVGYPYIMAYASPLESLLQRVLEGNHHGAFFFREGTFDDEDGPPLRVRVRTYVLERTSIAELRGSGKWWTRTYLGPHQPETERRDDFWDDLCPPPEVWHFDCVIWRRRSVLRHMMRRARDGEPPTEAAIADVDDLDTSDVERFWNELWPTCRDAGAPSWKQLPDAVEAVRAQWDRRELRKLERVLGRLGVMLCVRLEPLFLYRGTKPELPVTSYFHLGMLAHHIIGLGRETYEKVYADPPSAAAYVDAMTMESGAYYLALFRYEAFVFQARKQRLLQAVLNTEREEQPDYEIPPAIAKLQDLARALFGCIPLIEFVETQFQDERHHCPEEPEMHPRFIIQKDGTTRVELRERKVALGASSVEEAEVSPGCEDSAERRRSGWMAAFVLGKAPFLVPEDPRFGYPVQSCRALPKSSRTATRSSEGSLVGVIACAASSRRGAWARSTA